MAEAPARGEPIVVVRGLSKSFGRVEAVREVSFTAHRGEIFGLLGPNGAGKTTTLRLLATTLRPTAGTATVASHDIIHDAVGVRRSIGVLTAAVGLYNRLTVRENLAYFARLYGLTEAQVARRVGDVIGLLDMASYADRRADQLSSGMKQRAAIARAIVHDPPVLIFDEPTAALDVAGARLVLDFIDSSRLDGRCVLLSTHIMPEADKLCDHVAVIVQGHIVAHGTVGEVVARAHAADLEDALLRLIAGAGPSIAVAAR
jgi:sodium transport system ATP-binding protein